MRYVAEVRSNFVSAPLSEPTQDPLTEQQGLGDGEDYGLEAVEPVSGDYASDRNRKAQGSHRALANTEIQKSTAVKRIEQRLTVAPVREIARPSIRTAEAVVLPPLPHKTKTGRGPYVGFAICVIVPMALASIYYGLIASNQYVTEFRFTVTDTNAPTGVASSSNVMSMLGLGATSGSTTNDNYMVTDFLTSRQAAEDLQKKINVEGLYSKSNIDWLSRFNSKKPLEDFVHYWGGMVSSQYDTVTGIASAQVRAFSPHDTLLIANTLVSMSEKLVNDIANRSNEDAVRFSESEVEKYQARYEQEEAKLTAYRNKFGLIDPTSSVAASNSTLIQTLRANLAQLQTQLTTFESQHLTPNAPAIVSLTSQIKSTQEQLARTEADVGHGQYGSALSTVVGDYEQLNLQVQFDQAMVTGTLQALAQARENAAQQHLFITPYVKPSLPQSSTYPQRLYSVAMVGAVAFALWLIGLMIMRSIRERFG
jgi:capsular polysaccharide transport system permease protein